MNRHDSQRPKAAAELTGRMRPSKSKTLRRTAIGIGVLGIVLLAALAFASSRGDSESASLLTYKLTRGDLIVSVTEQGVLESSKNTEIKCNVRGTNTIIWVIENGTEVEVGDELVRLDTLEIEDAINERSKYAHWSRSGAERSEATVARAKLAISEYLEGRFVSQMMTLEKELAMAESNLLIAQNRLDHARKRSERGFAHDLEIEQKEVTVRQSELEVDVKKTQIEVLNTYTKKMQLETLQGDLRAAEATHAANLERAVLDETRRDQALDEFKDCVIKAEKSGLVIYPSAAAWKEAPEIEEGASVHKNQVLLLMPDLEQMQVKIGIHESIIDRVKPGQLARVKLPELDVDAKVETVATVARPAGWWTGNMVEYDTIVKLPQIDGLKPGMSAAVEIVIADHIDVLRVPVSAVLETDAEMLCWVQTANGVERRSITISDSNDVYLAVESGLAEGEDVVLDPLANIKEAQDEALKSMDETDSNRGLSEEKKLASKEGNQLPPK